MPRVEINVEIYGWFTFAFTVKTRPQAWFVDGCVVYQDKYGSLALSMELSRLITDMESENMESTMAYGEEGILKGYRSRSPSSDTVSFRAISPLSTPPTDAAPEIRLHDSVKVQGSLNMEEKSTVNGAAELESDARKKIATDKGKQYEIQRLKERRTVALRHVTRQINKMKPLLVDLNNFEFVSFEMEGFQANQ